MCKFYILVTNIQNNQYSVVVLLWTNTRNCYSFKHSKYVTNYALKINSLILKEHE